MRAMVALLCGGLAPAAFADSKVQRENALPGTTAWQQRLGDNVAVYGTQIAARRRCPSIRRFARAGR